MSSPKRPPAASLSQAEFALLLQQAQLTLTPKEYSALQRQLSEALEAVTVLRQLPTSIAKKTSTPSELINVWRPDQVLPSLTQAEALANALRTHQGYFVAPHVFSNHDS